MYEKQSYPKESVEITKKAKEAYQKWQKYFKYNHDQYHNMHVFVMGSQWNKEESDILKSFKKIPLQFNKLSTLINTLLGEQQQNTPQIQVNPLSNCNEQTAEIRQILAKDIMLSSDAKTVYQIAASQAFIGGFGAYVIDTAYTHDKSFDQDIVYRPVKDATHCYWDIGAEHPNKIDGMRCGYITRMTREKFAQVYGKKTEERVLKEKGTSDRNTDIAATIETPAENGLGFEWADDDSITIIDDYEREYTKDTLYKMSNGDILNEEEMAELVISSREHIRKEQAMLAMQLGMEVSNDDFMVEPPEDMASNEEILEQDPERMALYIDGELVRIEDSREYKRSKMIHKKIAGDYILEESEFPSEDCPVIFVDQNSFYDKNGKQVCRPFITDAVDAQRFLNYLGTQIAYLLKISRYDQFIGNAKNVGSPETAKIWTDPSSVQGLLKYDSAPDGSKPEQLRPPELPISLIQQYQRAIEDMYTSTGMYPSRLGQQGNEISGAAIDARTRQGSYPTFVAFNAINRAITAGGSVVNQMIPRVYDTQRVMSLMFPDKGRQPIVINEQTDEYGEAIRNDIRKGTFEVILQAGPSYEGQKEEALISLNNLLKANPAMFNLVADLVAENLPLSNTLEIKNRLKTLVPPEIIQAGKTGEMPKEAQRPNPQDQAAMAEAEYKKHKMQLEQKKLEMEAHMTQTKADMEAKRLEMEYMQMASELEGSKLRYMAEMERTHSDNAVSHADNITKLIIAKQKESRDAIE